MSLDNKSGICHIYLKLVRLVLMFSVAFTLFSCGEKEDDAPDLSVSSQAFHFTTLAGEKYAVIITNRPDYTATVEAGQTWVKAEKINIVPPTLKISVEASEVEAEREAKIIVHADGVPDVELRVRQAAYIPPLRAPDATVKWNATAPGNIEWYKRGADRTIGTPAGTAPSTVAGPGDIQAWALGQDDHIKVLNPLPNPTKVYTILWDIRMAALSGFCSLLQTKTDNDDGDGDIFINGKKIGLSSYSGDVFTENTWHRLIVVVDVVEAKSALFYVDGQTMPVLIKKVESDGDIDRYTLKDIFWLFLDEGDEVYPIDCAGVALWDVTLSDAEVASLGDPTTPVR